MKTIRGIIIALSVLLTACGGGQPTEKATGQAEEAKTYQWKLITTWPKNYPGLGTAPENFAKWVETATNGRIRIKVYGAGQLVPALEVFDAVSQGTAELGHGAAYYWKGKTPAATFFTSVPFGLNAQEMNGWLYHGGGMALWRELYAPFNLVPLAAGNTGVQMGGWFNREINSMADIKGLKMRIPGVGGEVITQAGGEAVTIPGSELYTAMQTGVVDATEWVGPYNDRAFGFHQVARYYYYPGWQEPGPSLELIVNKQVWDDLPEDLREIITLAARAVNQDMLDEYTARNNAAMSELVEKHGVELRKFPDEVLTTLHDITDRVLEEMTAQDPLAKKVYESQKAFGRQAQSYHTLSEEAYYRARKLGRE